MTTIDEQICVNKLLQSLPPGAPGYWTDMSDLGAKGIWRFTEAFNNEPNMNVMLVLCVHDSEHIILT